MDGPEERIIPGKGGREGGRGGIALWLSWVGRKRGLSQARAGEREGGREGEKEE